MEDRQAIQVLLTEATAQGARRKPACEILGISVRTWQRWQRTGNTVDGRKHRCRQPHNKLSNLEQETILAVINRPEHASLAPSQIVPKLADKGKYLASESTLYRLLRAQKQLKHRQLSQPRHYQRPNRQVATGPNQIYSWDITYLPTTIRGYFYYLYVFLDIFSRKIVGWQIYEVESSAHAATILEAICHQEGIKPKQLLMHSDNGAPMKGVSMLTKMQALGVIPSFSRPSVSDDNAYVESLFRTVKYAPKYPGRFDDLAAARLYIDQFVTWYNTSHRHSGIKFVTPSQRHEGLDVAILAKREAVYKQARAKNPERWSGNTRNWSHIDKVYLIPEKGKTKTAVVAAV